jgi:DNA-directed RNA polymerase subunit RPC12/RpoP
MSIPASSLLTSYSAEPVSQQQLQAELTKLNQKNAALEQAVSKLAQKIVNLKKVRKSFSSDREITFRMICPSCNKTIDLPKSSVANSTGKHLYMNIRYPITVAKCIICSSRIFIKHTIAENIKRNVIVVI